MVLMYSTHLAHINTVFRTRNLKTFSENSLRILENIFRLEYLGLRLEHFRIG